jgi:hypothetical protein
MTQATDNQLIFEILKKVQSDVAVIKTDVAEVKAMELRMREDFNRFEGDLLRFEQRGGLRKPGFDQNLLSGILPTWDQRRKMPLQHSNPKKSFSG